MNLLRCLLVLGFAGRLLADSGGPYEFVPDLRPEEHAPTNAIDSTLTKPLEFYATHIPVPHFKEGEMEPSSLEWRANEDFDPFPAMEDLGWLAGRQMVAVRYIPREEMGEGRSGRAIGILLLARSEGGYSPVFFTTGGVTDDHTASDVVTFGGQDFVVLEVHYSGQGSLVEFIGIGLDPETEKFRRDDLSGGREVWNALKKDGWEPWHRGHWLDVQTMTWHHHIYRDPKKHPNAEGNPHATLTVPLEFTDGAFRAGKWSISE